MNILKELPFVKDISIEHGATYLVGGYVRDLLLRKISKDVDLLVTGIPIEDLINILEKYGKVDQVGKSFGVLKMKYKQYDLDVALPRTEVKTGRGHTGFEVEAHHGITLYSDLKRRDFTMNAIALDERDRYYDPFGGIQDIIKKEIRAVSLETFSDDPLRMLRAFQFSARFNFKISEITLGLIKANSASISEISKERVYEEFQKLLKGDVHSVLQEMIDSGIVKELFFHDIKIPFTNKVSRISELLFALNSQKSDYLLNQGKFLANQKYRHMLTVDDRKEIFSLGEYNGNRLKTYKLVQSCDLLLHTEFFGERISVLDGYPKSRKELDITSQEIMDEGFEGKHVGIVYRMIEYKVLKDKIKNNKEEILNYIKRFKK